MVSLTAVQEVNVLHHRFTESDQIQEMATTGSTLEALIQGHAPNICKELLDRLPQPLVLPRRIQ